MDETKPCLSKIQVLRNANARCLVHGESRSINYVLQRLFQNFLENSSGSHFCISPYFIVHCQSTQSFISPSENNKESVYSTGVLPFLQLFFLNRTACIMRCDVVQKFGPEIILYLSFGVGRQAVTIQFVIILVNANLSGEFGTFLQAPLPKRSQNCIYLS